MFDWVSERRGKEVQVANVSGVLDTFIVETFVPHSVCQVLHTHIYVCAHAAVASFTFSEAVFGVIERG